MTRERVIGKDSIERAIGVNVVRGSVSGVRRLRWPMRERRRELVNREKPRRGRAWRELRWRRKLVRIMF